MSACSVNRAVRVIGGLILVGCLVAFVLSQPVPADLGGRIGWAIAAAQPSLFIAQGLMALRFRTIVGPGVARLRECLQASLLVQVSDLALPAKASEVIRVTYLKQKTGLDLAKGVASVFVERISDLFVVALLIALGALVVAEANVLLFLLVALAVGAAFLLLPRMQPMLSALIGHLPFAGLRDFGQLLLHEIVLRRQDGRFIRVLAPTLAIWLLGLSATWAYLSVAGVLTDVRIAHAPLVVVMSVFVLTTIGNAVAVLPASIGTYEAGIVAALGYFGIPFDESLTLGIGLHLAHLLLGFVGGSAVLALNWQLLLRGVANFSRART